MHLRPGVRRREREPRGAPDAAALGVRAGRGRLQAGGRSPCCTPLLHPCCTPLLHPCCTLCCTRCGTPDPTAPSTPSLHSSPTLHPSPYCALHPTYHFTTPCQLTTSTIASLLHPPSHYSTISLLTRITTTTPSGCRLHSQGAKRVKTHGATYVPREQLSGISTAGSKKPAPIATAQAAAEQQVKVEGEAASRAKRAKRRGAA